MPIGLTKANAVIEKAHAKAEQLGIRVTVAIVDEGGHLVALSRMDGAISLSPQLAEAKAVGAAMFGRDGEALAKMAQDRPGFFSAADRLVRVPLIPGLGSALIAEDGRTIGAIGVSGGRPDQDLECAQAGLDEL
jgi:glc operon protein GlcG